MTDAVTAIVVAAKLILPEKLTLGRGKKWHRVLIKVFEHL